MQPARSRPSHFLEAAARVALQRTTDSANCSASSPNQALSRGYLTVHAGTILLYVQAPYLYGRATSDNPPRERPMSGETPEEQEPCADVGVDVGDDGQEVVDCSLVLAGFDPELLLQLAEMLGNPLALLVSKAHLSKAFCEAARNAQGLLKHIDLCVWKRTVNDAVVAAVASKCPQLSSLNLHGCKNITDEAAKAVGSGCTQLTWLDLGGRHSHVITDAALVALASGCTQLTTLIMCGCWRELTDAALVAVASGCPQLSSLDLSYSFNITDQGVVAVAAGCPQLMTLNLGGCGNITDVAVVAVASGCKLLTALNLTSSGNPYITDVALLAVASKCPQLSSLNVAYCYHITDAAVVAVASACAHLTSLDLRGCYHITNVAVVAVASECDQLTMLDLGGCFKITDEEGWRWPQGARRLTALRLLCARARRGETQ